MQRDNRWKEGLKGGGQYMKSLRVDHFQVVQPPPKVVLLRAKKRETLMPVGIKCSNDLGSPQFGICPDSWDLAEQVEEFKIWLNANSMEFHRSSNCSWIADFGFAPRESASGGGPVLDIALMQLCIDLNIVLAFSEYTPLRPAVGSRVNLYTEWERKDFLSNLRQARNCEEDKGK